jgi:hypothetical protein
LGEPGRHKVAPVAAGQHGAESLGAGDVGGVIAAEVVLGDQSRDVLAEPAIDAAQGSELGDRPDALAQSRDRVLVAPS